LRAENSQPRQSKRVKKIGNLWIAIRKKGRKKIKRAKAGRGKSWACQGNAPEYSVSLFAQLAQVVPNACHLPAG